jgi:hypothetical protein
MEVDSAWVWIVPSRIKMSSGYEVSDGFAYLNSGEHFHHLPHDHYQKMLAMKKPDLSDWAFHIEHILYSAMTTGFVTLCV